MKKRRNLSVPVYRRKYEHRIRFKSVSVGWLLNELSGMSFPGVGQAYDHFKKLLPRVT